MWQNNQTTLTKIGLIFLLCYSVVIEKPYIGKFGTSISAKVEPVEVRSYEELFAYKQGKMRLAVEKPLPKREIKQKNIKTEPQVASIAIEKKTPIQVSQDNVATPPQENKPEGEIHNIIKQVASEYSVNEKIMIAIAECESGFRPDAVNGQYAGIFQFHPSTWQSNRRAMGLDDSTNLRFDPTEAAKTAAFKMSRDGYGAWPSCSKKALIALN